MATILTFLRRAKIYKNLSAFSKSVKFMLGVLIGLTQRLKDRFKRMKNNLNIFILMQKGALPSIRNGP